MCSLINKQLLLTAYAYLFIMEQQKAQGGSEALQLQVESSEAQGGSEAQLAYEDTKKWSGLTRSNSLLTLLERLKKTINDPIFFHYCEKSFTRDNLTELLTDLGATAEDQQQMRDEIFETKQACSELKQQQQQPQQQQKEEKRDALGVEHDISSVKDVALEARKTLAARLIGREKKLRQLAQYWKCGPFCQKKEVRALSRQTVAENIVAEVDALSRKCNAEVTDAMKEFATGKWSGESEFLERGKIVTKMELAILKEKYLEIPGTNDKLWQRRTFLADPILSRKTALELENRDGVGLSFLVQSFQVDRLKFRLGISYNSWDEKQGFNEKKLMGGTYEDHGILRENSWRPKQSYLGEEGSIWKI